MWPNTTKGTSCLLLISMIPNSKNWRDTFGNTTFTKSVFPFIFFTFCTLLCPLSQNQLGRQDVPFVVLGHICSTTLLEHWAKHWSKYCCMTVCIDAGLNICAIIFYRGRQAFQNVTWITKVFVYRVGTLSFLVQLRVVVTFQKINGLCW